MDKVDLATLLVSHGRWQVEMLHLWMRDGLCAGDCKGCIFQQTRLYGVDHDKFCPLSLVNKLQAEFLLAEREALSKAGKEVETDG